MRQHLFAAASAAAILLYPSLSLAEGGTVSGAAGGAVTGAVIGGPVGAAVGGVAGAALGTAIDPPPPEVRRVVVHEEAPSVRIKKHIVVGEPLPQKVVLRPVPGYVQYRYAVVNDQRVIVDPKTRTVVQIVD
jgi:hypothetical protein